ncbi:MAG TPA: AprI/Inh family metalloprotease inhibitor [Xanthobacteraceae bacterium]
MIRHGILLTLGIACLIASAQAQTTLSDQAKAMTGGSWEFSNADRDKRCTIVFRTDAATVGMKLEFDKACAEAFPFVKEVVGWTLTENDFLRLLDARGKSMLEFSEVETGMFEAPRPGEGILFIQAVAALGPPPKEADQMLGDWGLVRGSGAPICTLTLANTVAGPDLALKLKPGCNIFVTRFAPTAWQMDRGELVLKNAKGQTWRFEESDSATWSRVPETADPLLLVRP